MLSLCRDVDFLLLSLMLITADAERVWDPSKDPEQHGRASGTEVRV